MPPKSAASKSCNIVRRGTPDFIDGITQDYKAQIAHVFVLSGNIYDFVDNAGNDLPLKKILAAAYDDHIKKSLSPETPVDNSETGVRTNCKNSPKTRIIAFYNTSTGLDWPDPKSKEIWVTTIKTALGPEVMEDLGGDAYFEPRGPEAAMALFSNWFKISKKLQMDNKIRKENGDEQRGELIVTLVLTDADTLVPRGDIANLGGDRSAIVNIRNWAQDREIGNRNRIILMTRHTSDIHDSIRGELAVSHIVRKPNLEDRTEWITNFNLNVKKRVEATGPVVVSDNKNVTGIDLAPDFTMEEFALQSAGMNRRQIKDVILNSWRSQVPIDFQLVQERKKRALEDEYGGMLDIKQVNFGFEQIGGHEAFKEYCLWDVIKPLKAGDKKMCSPGCLMLGPPGTGKTMLALALSYEAGLNFIEVDLGTVFGGVVGETEKNTRKLFEAIDAAAPCIVFMDEIDSVMSSGRTSAGDSGTSGRVFNSFMKYLSDPSRLGKVVILAATNRPDLLDAALIRAGRLDAKIPLLPPIQGDAAGRWAILAAQTKKHKIVLTPELIASKKEPSNGLGLLLNDKKRFWTGAEIEQVLKSALRRAARAERMLDGKADLRIAIEDWNHACKHNMPTGDVDAQIDLALQFSSGDYISEEWADRADEVKKRAAEKARELAMAA